MKMPVVEETLELFNCLLPQKH